MNLTWSKRHNCVFFRGKVSGELGLMIVEILSSRYARKKEGKVIENVCKGIVRVMEKGF